MDGMDEIDDMDGMNSMDGMGRGTWSIGEHG